MDRRGFFKGVTGLVAGVAVAEAIPFGRVWSFPANIVVPNNVWSVRLGDRFAIGDLISAGKFGPYIVTRIDEDKGVIDLYDRQRGHGWVNVDDDNGRMLRPLQVLSRKASLVSG